jgi:hypothetical protein
VLLPPADIVALLSHFAPLVSRQVWRHVPLLAVGAILAPGPLAGRRWRPRLRRPRSARCSAARRARHYPRTPRCASGHSSASASPTPARASPHRRAAPADPGPGARQSGDGLDSGDTYPLVQRAGTATAAASMSQETPSGTTRGLYPCSSAPVGAHPRSLGQVCAPSPALHRPGDRSRPDPALVCPALADGSHLS